MKDSTNNICIQLISSGKVVLVKCAGFESEIFVPGVVNGRLSLQNIVVERRCCRSDDAKRIEENKRAQTKKRLIRSPISQKPLANSTPAKEHESLRDEYVNPEMPRRAVYINIDKGLSIQLSTPESNTLSLDKSGIAKEKDVRNSQPPTLAAEDRAFRNLSNLSSFNTLPSISSNNAFLALSPSCGLLKELSTTSWRKCITPKKTYLDRNITRSSHFTKPEVQPKPLLFSKNGQLVPTHRLNPTQNPTGEVKCMIKRRKLTIDHRIKISPKTFKRQLQCAEDLNRIEFQLSKTKKQLNFSQLTAFDLLTNANYSSKIAMKLNLQFRKGCIYKNADTILKYKPLTLNLPRIENT